MATTYTSLLGLALPTTGELSGTWGDVVDNYITSFLDSAVAGAQTISGTQTAVTLSIANGTALTQAGAAGTTGSSQYQIINCTGNPAGTLTITAPASSKTYIIINGTSTSQSVKIVGAGPTTGVTVASGQRALVAWNGSDFVQVGASAGGSTTQVQYNNAGALAGSANLTFDGTTLTANAATVSNNLTLSAGTANGVLYLNGSKVATSGSALNYDGTNVALSGALTIGGASIASGNKLLVRSGVADKAVSIDNGSNSGFIVQFASGLTTIGNDFNAPLAFLQNNAERMRIDSSGNLLVGTTSGYGNRRLEVRGGVDGTYLSTFANTLASGAPSGIQVYYPSLSPNNTASQFLSCADSTTTRFDVRSNGGIANYQANDVNLSDRREKTNFAPAKSYLDTICSIPVQTFNYIDQNMEEDAGLTLGVVAQDVQAVAPELVHESNWGSKEEPKMRLSIYQTDLQYALMKCIQELKSELDSVKAELQSLKG